MAQPNIFVDVPAPRSHANEGSGSTGEVGSHFASDFEGDSNRKANRSRVTFYDDSKASNRISESASGDLPPAYRESGESENEYEPEDDEPLEEETRTDDSAEDDLYNLSIRQNPRTRLQQRFYNFFEKVNSPGAKVFSMLSIGFIFVTIIMICVDSLPQFVLEQERMYLKIWLPIDTVIVSFFTVEYFGRFYAATQKWKFAIKPMNVIDLVSIVPFYIQLFVPYGTGIFFRVVRVLRLLRILRIFDFARHSVGFRITTKVIKRSMYQILTVFSWAFVIILISSALMYIIERGEFDNKTKVWYRQEDGEKVPSPYQSIVHSFWWSIVTLTTVGYGDAVPITALGKLVASVTMLCGVLAIAMPTSIIGSNYVAEWDAHRQKRFTQRARGFDSPETMTRTKRIQVLRKRTETILQGISEVQARLAQINPPRWYVRYMDMKNRYESALEKIDKLERKVRKWKRKARNYEKFEGYTKRNKESDEFDKGNGRLGRLPRQPLSRLKGAGSSLWNLAKSPFYRGEGSKENEAQTDIYEEQPEHHRKVLGEDYVSTPTSPLKKLHHSHSCGSLIEGHTDHTNNHDEHPRMSTVVKSAPIDVAEFVGSSNKDQDSAIAADSDDTFDVPSRKSSSSSTSHQMVELRKPGQSASVKSDVRESRVLPTASALCAPRATRDIEVVVDKASSLSLPGSVAREKNKNTGL